VLRYADEVVAPTLSEFDFLYGELGDLAATVTPSKAAEFDWMPLTPRSSAASRS
jgi:hypothetical protein